MIMKDNGLLTVAPNIAPTNCNQDTVVAERDKFPIVALSSDQKASKNASRTILQWVTLNGEGIPSEGIYQDDWVKDFLKDEDEDEDEDEEEEEEEEVHSSDLPNCSNLESDYLQAQNDSDEK